MILIKAKDNQHKEWESKTSIFNKTRLKLEYEQKKKQAEEKKQQATNEMEDFQKIIEKIGPENIKIFAAQNGKAGYNIPKNCPVMDAEQSISSRPSIDVMH